MSSSNSAPTLRFPVRRDGWDTVDYYLLLLFGVQIAGLFFIMMGIRDLSGTPPQPMGWFLILLGAFHSVIGTITGILRTWRRFAEQYELTESEFVLQCGYCRQRVPYREISGVHPIKICRLTTALKPAVRIKFRKQTKPQEGENVAGIIEYDICGYKWNLPLVHSWSLDVSPVSLETFLEELADRCPHLQRDGLRFQLKSAGEK